jgi:transcriptional regulator with XRE-family HTH domain
MKAADLLAWNLRRLRVAQKLSQENLAVDADVDTSFISRIENGLENPSLALVERLANALNVQFVDLFKKPTKGEPHPQPLRSGRRRTR